MAPHPQRLAVTRRAWPLARPLMTAHGVQTTVEIVVAEISDVESRGRGEGVPLRRYDVFVEQVNRIFPDHDPIVSNDHGMVLRDASPDLRSSCTNAFSYTFSRNPVPSA
jgi:hypothetical protein